MTTAQHSPKLSIVATMYKSESYIVEFCNRVSGAAEAITSDFEIVLVNDGSPDDSLDVALRYRVGNQKVRVVDLSRNFGHHPAMITGLAQARGQFVYLTDIDLEEEPELLGRYWTTILQNTDVDVIAGLQINRAGSTFGNLLGNSAWSFLASISHIDLPQNMLTTRLMTRRFIEAVLTYPEREIFVEALFADAGYKQIFIAVQKQKQQDSTYSLVKRMQLFLAGLTSVSVAPLYFAIYLTLIMVAVLVGIVFYALWSALNGSNVPGWTSIVFLVALSTALILSVQSLMGIYLAHIFKEVKRRPLTVIRKIHE